jgi:hypothetical protein
VLKLGIVYERNIQNLVSVGDVEACQGAQARDSLLIEETEPCEG